MLCSAAAIASQTEVVAVMEALRSAGASILPDVWHQQAAKYMPTSPASASAEHTAQDKAAGPAEERWTFLTCSNQSKDVVYECKALAQSC
jgi:hypothetical protein